MDQSMLNKSVRISDPIGDRIKDLSSFQVSAVDPTSDEDIYQTLHRVASGIQKIFEAEETLLVLRDEEDPDLVMVSQLGKESEWKLQTVQKIVPGVIASTITTGQPMALVDAVIENLFNPAFDCPPDLQARTYLCAPLTAHGKTFGALALINPLEHMLVGSWMDLFQMLITSISNTVYDAQRFMQIKISNADLEANRWELLNSRNTLRALFDNLPTGIYIVDTTYTVIAINLSRANREGSQPWKFVGRKCYEKLHGRNGPCPGCQVAETLASGKSTNRFQMEHPGGAEFLEWEISTFPIFNETGKPIQAIITENDVTEKRILEANLIRSEKMAAVGQVAASLAHEMYNPLAAIVANTQMMRRTLPQVNEDLFDSLDLIEYAGARASQVIQNLQSIVQKEDLESAPLDINETIESSLAMFSHEISNRPIAIVKDFQIGLPVLIGSRNHMQSIWVNLLNNAFKQAPQKDARVTIITRYSEGEYQITFQDNGNGIPANQLGHVFEPYFSPDPNGRSESLGLSICMRAVRQINGTIEVESQPDQGSSFTVRLPR